MILFLALLGRAGHGKSTVAKHLQAKYGAKTIALADPLKRCARAVMGFTYAQLWGTQEDKEAIDPRFGFSCRRFLQLLGTEGMRKEFGENIHLDRMISLIQQKEGAGGRAVYYVEDGRFVNEVEYINGLGLKTGYPNMRGATLKIVCTDAPTLGNSLTQFHSSESEIDRVPESELAATVVSSRAQGTAHLIEEVDKAIQASPRLRTFKVCASDFGVKS